MKREELDEHLEALWHLQENDESDIGNFKSHIKGGFNEENFKTLKSDDYITIEGDKIHLTKKGYNYAERIIRRHRLAERLLTDVLGMEIGDIEKGACEVEHILAPELVESICTLLGHPKECPHGGKIPEGECCRQTRKIVSSAVVPLSEINVGEELDSQARARDNLLLGSIREIIEVGTVARYSHHQLRIFAWVKASIFKHLRIEDIQLHFHSSTSEESLDQTDQHLHSSVTSQSAGVEA